MTSPIKKEVQIGDCRLLLGDCLAVLKSLPDESVDCVVTSPPYWGLRDYGVDGQLGLEPTLGEHLAAMVAVFEEVKRVLKSTGTCFVNYGDCYATSPNGRSAAVTKDVSDDDRTFRDKPFSTVGPVYDSDYPERTYGLNDKQLTSKGSLHKKGRVVSGGYMKPKDLCMVPNRFAIAMQEAGWWVRSEIIWAKPNPMPESIKDRPATAHEKIWLFTKEQKYHWDDEAVRIPSKYTGLQGQDESGFKNPQNFNGKHKDGYRSSKPKTDKQRGHSRRHAGFNDRWDSMSKEEQAANGRNLRNYEPAPVEVWNIATKPFSEAHFATFPPELAKRCIEAGCPSDGVVLDIFGGAGTTGFVASQLQRKSILIELNPEYLEIAAKRIETDAPLISAIAEKQSEATQEKINI